MPSFSPKHFRYHLRILMVLLFIILPMIQADAGSNVCALGEVSNLGGLTFSVQITVSNSDTLAGFQIPFSFAYGNIGIRCDSISIHGSDCDNFAFQDIKIDNASKRAYLSAINNSSPEDNIAPLAPGQHIIATTYFSIDQLDSTLAVVFAQDSIPDEYRNYSFLFWTPQTLEVPGSLSFGNLTLR